MKIEIEKELFFELLNSHSTLAQREYNNNPDFNSDHFAHIVEMKIIKILNEYDITKEFCDYSEQNVLMY